MRFWKSAQLDAVQDDVNAAAVARMVDMSLEEVADLLGGASSHSPGDADSALLAKQVAQTLLELEAALLSGSSKHASKQSRATEEQANQQALEEMLEGLQHQASKYELKATWSMNSAVFATNQFCASGCRATNSGGCCLDSLFSARCDPLNTLT